MESLGKSIQAMCAAEKPAQKQITSPGNCSSHYSTGSGFKKGGEAPVIKAVRKAPTPNPTPSSINLSSKKKVSMKKEPSPIPQTPTGPSNKSAGSSAKEQF